MQDHQTNAVHPEPSQPSVRSEHTLSLCRLYAKARRPILLLGPVGAGKSTLARLIHDLSGASGRFVAVSAGELTETLYADTLFGHVSGAYTGATASREGAFVRAANGTLLLDDLALMSLPVQASILRVLEDRAFFPLGSMRETAVTGREIFASTVEPHELLSQSKLLPDLESRLGELIIRVPSLRDREAEIPLLILEIAAAYLRELGRNARVEFSPEVLPALRQHGWPKNFRELKGVIERAVLHASAKGEVDVIQVDARHLPDRFLQSSAEDRQREPHLSPHLVQFVLDEARGNQSEAARRLGVHRNTIARYVRTG